MSEPSNQAIPATTTAGNKHSDLATASNDDARTNQSTSSNHLSVGSEASIWARPAASTGNTRNDRKGRTDKERTPGHARPKGATTPTGGGRRPSTTRASPGTQRPASSERGRQSPQHHVRPAAQRPTATDRTATGGTRARVDEDELARKMERIRLQNEQLLRRREEVAQDEEAYRSSLEREAHLQQQREQERQAREVRDRTVMQKLAAEREENARRKLATRQQRAWDSEKQQQVNGRWKAAPNTSEQPTMQTTANYDEAASHTAQGRPAGIRIMGAAAAATTSEDSTALVTAVQLSSPAISGESSERSCTSSAKATPKMTGEEMDQLFVWPPPDADRVAWGDEEVSTI